MKSQKELQQLHQRYQQCQHQCQSLQQDLSELSEEELQQVCGGNFQNLWNAIKDLGKKITSP